MDFTVADPVARALLYEGYLLYPYRESALKNRMPSPFGALYPKAYSLANGETEPWSMQIECLVRGDSQTMLQGLIRFLHPSGIDGREVTEREVILPECALHELAKQSARIPFAFLSPASLTGQGPGLKGYVELSVEAASVSVFKVRVRIANETSFAEVDDSNRIEPTMLSTHAMLGVGGGRFLSLIDPPDDVRALADTCRNRGAWPVLVGDPDRQDMILAAPIILYDFPQIAPESPGNLLDGTEIDELLTLRILTLTDAEKQAMKHDERTRALLERTESLADDQLLALHGAMQSEGREERDVRRNEDGDDFPRPLPLASHGSVRSGARVRLYPQGRADILDLALEGKAATIASIEQDFEGHVFYAVTLDDDPGQDLGREGKPGHRFFFRREELELLSGEE